MPIFYISVWCILGYWIHVITMHMPCQNHTEASYRCLQSD